MYYCVIYCIGQMQRNVAGRKNQRWWRKMSEKEKTEKKRFKLEKTIVWRLVCLVLGAGYEELVLLWKAPSVINYYRMFWIFKIKQDGKRQWFWHISIFRHAFLLLGGSLRRKLYACQLYFCFTKTSLHRKWISSFHLPSPPVFINMLSLEENALCVFMIEQ